MKSKARSLLKFLIGWPLTIVALFFVIKFIVPNISSVAVAIRGLNFWILSIGILCLLVYFLIRSFFWKKMLSYKGTDVSWKEITWLWGSSEFQRYIPGNIWAFVGRASYFSKKKISKNTTLSLFLFEAEFIVVSSLLLSLFCINFVVYALLPVFPYKSFLVIAITIIALLFIVLFLGNQYIIKALKLTHSLEIGKWKIKIDFLPNNSFRINFTLFFIQTMAMFFFGLGTYFSISSLTLLYPLYVPTFIGFFVFSLLVGYLSFITPMGLGIREGVITAGLMKFIPLSIAGFASLFARVIFIFSELLFLIIALCWYKTKNQLVLRYEKHLEQNWQPFLLGIFIVIYSAYMLIASFAKYTNFYTGRFDLGNMDQTVWNTLHGRIFQMTDANGTTIVSRLAFHADFILVLLAPFYFIWQDPRMLLLIQTITLAAGAIFIYLIAKDIVKNRNSSLLFAGIYLLNPSVNYTNLYDFHPVTLATTFLLGAFYFLKKQKYIWYILFLILAGLTKEEVWLIVGLFGLYTIILAKGKSAHKTLLRVLGGSIFVVGTGLAYYLVSYLIPHVSGSAHFALSYYSDFGSSPLSILKGIFFKPQKTIGTLLQPGQLGYILELFFPLGFISLLSPFLLIFAAPDLLIDLLSNDPSLHQIYYQYPASITPFIFIAAIYGFHYFTTKFPKLKIHTTYYVLLIAVVSAYFFGPLPGSWHPGLNMFDSPLPYAETINSFLNSIPKKYSIAATNNVGSHLSHRQKIFTIPVGIDKADIIVFLLNDPGAQPSLAAQKIMAENMKRDKNYIEVFKEGDLIVFEKRNLYIQREPNLNHTTLFPLSIPALQHRDYIGGEITVEKMVEDKGFAKSYLISYPSDGLKLFALMEVPTTTIPKKGFPVVILNHDFFPAGTYDTIKTDAGLTDFFAKKGFLVLKPDYRGYGLSETDTISLNPLPYSIDVLNLISSLYTEYQADSNQVYLWGQGLGGEVTLKTLEITGENKDDTIQHKIQAAVIWSPVITPFQWPPSTYTNIVKKFGTQRTNPLFWQSISIVDYIDDVHTPTEIDQGTLDTTNPYVYSIELYNDLVSFNKGAVLRLIPNDNHVLSKSRNTILQGNIQFFHKHIPY